MLKNIIATTALLLLSSSAFAELKGLDCVGTEPFWSLNIDTDKNQMTYTSPDSLKGKPMKIKEQSQAFGLKQDLVVVFKHKTRDISATVLSSVISGAKCNDGMSDNEYEFHVVYRNGAKTFYGCCDLK